MSSHKEGHSVSLNKFSSSYWGSQDEHDGDESDELDPLVVLQRATRPIEVDLKLPVDGTYPINLNTPSLTFRNPYIENMYKVSRAGTIEAATATFIITGLTIEGVIVFTLLGTNKGHGVEVDHWATLIGIVIGLCMLLLAGLNYMLCQRRPDPVASLPVGGEASRKKRRGSSTNQSKDLEEEVDEDAVPTTPKEIFQAAIVTAQRAEIIAIVAVCVPCFFYLFQPFSRALCLEATAVVTSTVADFSNTTTTTTSSSSSSGSSSPGPTYYCTEKITPYAVMVILLPLLVLNIRGHITCIIIVVYNIFAGIIRLIAHSTIDEYIPEGESDPVVPWMHWQSVALWSVCALLTVIVTERFNRRSFITNLLLLEKEHVVEVHRKHLNETLKALLPGIAVRRLAAGLSVEDYADQCTISVCEIKDFHYWSTTVMPDFAMESVDVLYSAFDQFLESQKEHGTIHKVVMTGDLYIIAAGLRGSIVSGPTHSTSAGNKKKKRGGPIRKGVDFAQQGHHGENPQDQTEGECEEEYEGDEGSHDSEVLAARNICTLDCCRFAGRQVSFAECAASYHLNIGIGIARGASFGSILGQHYLRYNLSGPAFTEAKRLAKAAGKNQAFTNLASMRGVSSLTSMKVEEIKSQRGMANSSSSSHKRMSSTESEIGRRSSEGPTTIVPTTTIPSPPLTARSSSPSTVDEQRRPTDESVGEEEEVVQHPPEGMSNSSEHNNSGHMIGTDIVYNISLFPAPRPVPPKRSREQRGGHHGGQQRAVSPTTRANEAAAEFEAYLDRPNPSARGSHGKRPQRGPGGNNEHEVSSGGKGKGMGKKSNSNRVTSKSSVATSEDTEGARNQRAIETIKMLLERNEGALSLMFVLEETEEEFWQSTQSAGLSTGSNYTIDAEAKLDLLTTFVVAFVLYLIPLLQGNATVGHIVLTSLGLTLGLLRFSLRSLVLVKSDDDTDGENEMDASNNQQYQWIPFWLLLPQNAFLLLSTALIPSSDLGMLNQSHVALWVMLCFTMVLANGAVSWVHSIPMSVLNLLLLWLTTFFSQFDGSWDSDLLISLPAALVAVIFVLGSYTRERERRAFFATRKLSNGATALLEDKMASHRKMLYTMMPAYVVEDVMVKVKQGRHCVVQTLLDCVVLALRVHSPTGIFAEGGASGTGARSGGGRGSGGLPPTTSSPSSPTNIVLNDASPLPGGAHHHNTSNHSHNSTEGRVAPSRKYYGQMLRDHFETMERVLTTLGAEAVSCSLIRMIGDTALIGGPLLNMKAEKEKLAKSATEMAQWKGLGQRIAFENAAGECGVVLVKTTAILKQKYESFLTAALSYGSGYAAVLGEYLPSFDLLGSAARCGMEMVEASPDGYVGCTEGFLKLLENTQHDGAVGKAGLDQGPGVSWRLRGAGQVKVFPLRHRQSTSTTAVGGADQSTASSYITEAASSATSWAPVTEETTGQQMAVVLDVVEELH